MWIVEMLGKNGEWLVIARQRTAHAAARWAAIVAENDPGCTIAYRSYNIPRERVMVSSAESVRALSDDADENALTGGENDEQ